MGAVSTTPAANPENTSSTRAVTRPAVGPPKRYTVPSPNQGTLMMAPVAKKTRNDALLHPRASAHHNDNAATANNPMATVHANSCARRRRSQRSRVLRPKATATIADAAASAVFNVTLAKARSGALEFLRRGRGE